jgi:hypothetical protein
MGHGAWAGDQKWNVVGGLEWNSLVRAIPRLQNEAAFSLMEKAALLRNIGWGMLFYCTPVGLNYGDVFTARPRD